MKNIIPDKPSDVLKQALKDLKACEKDPNYKVDMGHYHKPGNGGICYVCLGGAFLAKTIKWPRTQTVCGISPWAWDTIRMLNGLRNGVFLNKLWMFTADYHENPKQFYKDMKALAKRLRKAGH